MPLFVFDPSVLIAALISPNGRPARLLRLWVEGWFELIVCPLLLREVEDVLERPKLRSYVTAEEAALFVELLSVSARSVPDPQVSTSWTRDPGDDYLVELASSTGARGIVSVDRDLLEATGLPVQVLDPAAALELLG